MERQGPVKEPEEKTWRERKRKRASREGNLSVPDQRKRGRSRDGYGKTPVSRSVRELSCPEGREKGAENDKKGKGKQVSGKNSSNQIRGGGGKAKGRKQGEKRNVH